MHSSAGREEAFDDFETDWETDRDAAVAERGDDPRPWQGCPGRESRLQADGHRRRDTPEREPEALLSAAAAGFADEGTRQGNAAPAFSPICDADA